MGTAESSSIRIVVIDDYPRMCAAMERWLASVPGLTPVGAITDWRQAESEVRRLQPDIVLLDGELPGTTGTALIEPLLTASPGVKVIMLSGRSGREDIMPALDAGAAGYIVKGEDPAVIVELLKGAAAGEVVLCPTAKRAV